MRTSTHHIAVYCNQHSPIWTQCAKQIKQGLNRLHHTINSLHHVLRSDGPGTQHLRLEAGRYSLAVPEHTWLNCGLPMFQELCC